MLVGALLAFILLAVHVGLESAILTVMFLVVLKAYGTVIQDWDTKPRRSATLPVGHAPQRTAPQSPISPAPPH